MVAEKEPFIFQSTYVSRRHRKEAAAKWMQTVFLVSVEIAMGLEGSPLQQCAEEPLLRACEG